MILQWYGFENVQAALRDIAGVWAYGTDLLTLARTAERFGFRADGVRMRYQNLLSVPLPLIAHYRGNHFVVVYRATESHVWIADPGIGKEKLTKDEFLARWNGIALLLEPPPRSYHTRTSLTSSNAIANANGRSGACSVQSSSSDSAARSSRFSLHRYCWLAGAEPAALYAGDH